MPNKISTSKDFKHERLIKLNNKGLEAYNNIKKRFRGSYPRLKDTLASFAFQYLNLKTKKLRAGDDIEAYLGLIRDK